MRWSIRPPPAGSNLSWPRCRRSRVRGTATTSACATPARPVPRPARAGGRPADSVRGARAHRSHRRRDPADRSARRRDGASRTLLTTRGGLPPTSEGGLYVVYNAMHFEWEAAKQQLKMTEADFRGVIWRRFRLGLVRSEQICTRARFPRESQAPTLREVLAYHIAN